MGDLARAVALGGGALLGGVAHGDEGHELLILGDLEIGLQAPAVKDPHDDGGQPQVVGGQAEGLGGDAAVVVLPALPPVGGVGPVPLKATAVGHKGLGDEDGAVGDDGGVVGAGQAEPLGDLPLELVALNGDVAADLGVFPAGGVGGQGDDLLDLGMADGLVGEFPVTAPGEDAGFRVHGRDLLR